MNCHPPVLATITKPKILLNFKKIHSVNKHNYIFEIGSVCKSCDEGGKKGESREVVRIVCWEHNNPSSPFIIYQHITYSKMLPCQYIKENKIGL